MLTNLAKAQTARGDDAQALQTLWRGLTLDPNQDNALLWYESIHRSKGGEAAALAAFERVAALPESWRAQLWVARARLATNDLDAAMELYRESLKRTSNPAPTDVLMQISGDLGNKGHLPQIIELITPHFDLSLHGLQVGNNLLKANLDLGRLDTTASLLQQLQLQQRPDWKENLSYWENELAKLRNETVDTPNSAKQLKVILLTLDGPLWLKDEHPFEKRFPKKSNNAPRITFTGCTAETSNMGTEIRTQQSNSAGRMSRALPLFLNEQISLSSEALSSGKILWSTHGHGGFVLAGVASSDQSIAETARMGEQSIPGASAPDFAVDTHLLARGENWQLQLRLIRTIDATCLARFDYDFAESAFHAVANKVLTDLKQSLTKEAGLHFSTHPDAQLPQGNELDHYLLRLEQCLAVRCSGMDDTNKKFLSNPAEIIDGTIQFCLQNPTHLPGRLLLRHTIEGINKLDPKLVGSFQGKIETLQNDFPIKDLETLLETYFQEVTK